jgi:esterase/lipase superfamily enzyme
MTKDQFVANLRDRIAESHRKSALVFIHGYNESFADSVRRTAQLAYDLDFDGAPIAYSWPSNGSFLAYAADAANADWTGRHLHEFLSLVARESGAEEASLIVHSMGNRALAAALNDLAQSPTVGGMTFREIVLAAPDLDRDTFREQIAPAFGRTAARVTLYASDRDEALKASKRLSVYPRAGDTDGGIVLAAGIESIDASAVDTSLLGHSYFAEERPVLKDLEMVVQGHLRPDQRPTVGPMLGGKYWQVRAEF